MSHTKKVHIYDNFLDADQHEDLYQWMQDKSFYAYERPVYKLHEDGHYEYIAEKDGLSPNPKTHLQGDIERTAMKRIKTGLPRFPIATSQSDFDRKKFPLINSIWDKINKEIFKGNASVDGIPEDCVYKYRDESYIGGKQPHEKWDHLNEGDCFYTVFVNGRSTEHAIPEVKTDASVLKVSGRGHRDSNCREYDQTVNNYVTVLLCANLDWKPIYGGDILTWDDAPDNEFKCSSTHQAFHYGWLDNVIAHVPNRLIVFSHAKTHGPIRLSHRAPERSFRLAFRAKILNGEFTG